MFHFQLSARPKPKQWKRHNGGWILDIIVRNHIVAFRLQCSPPASSLLPSWPLVLFYCIYFCINLSSLLPLLCLLSHFTRASPIPCTVRVTMGKKVQRVCFSSYFIICSHFHAQKQLSHKWLTCFPFKFNWQWLADLACQSDNSYKQQVIFRVNLLLLSYVGDYNSPHPFPSPPQQQ